jgi:hypothetical protein
MGLTFNHVGRPATNLEIKREDHFKKTWLMCLGDLATECVD